MASGSQVEVIQPRDEAHWLGLRKFDITSTRVAALFGADPRLSEFELFHYLSEAAAPEFEENERSAWGKKLQDVIGQAAAETLGLKDLRPMPEYIRIPSLRLASSFDFAIGEDGILEAKNVDGMIFRDEWIEGDDVTIAADGDKVEAPLRIEVQIQTELAVSQRKYCWLSALVGGNRLVKTKRLPDAKTIEAIKLKAAAMWKRVDAKEAPEPNFTRDAKFISRLYGFADEGKVISADSTVQGLAREYRNITAVYKEAGSQRDALKAQILMQIGSAERVLGDEFTISAGIIKGGPISFVKEDYRGWRVNFKKEKAI
jgi:predicted phage-related endonuclease